MSAAPVPAGPPGAIIPWHVPADYRAADVLRAPDELFCSGLPYGAMVLWQVVRKVQGKNEWAWAKQETYAEAMGSSRTQVNRWVRLLAEHGWLEEGAGLQVRCHVGRPLPKGSPKCAENAHPSAENARPGSEENARQSAESAHRGVRETHTGCEETAHPSEPGQGTPSLNPPDVGRPGPARAGERAREAGGREADGEGVELSWLGDVKVPLSERERDDHAEHIAEAWRRAEREGWGLGELYRQTFGGGVRPMPAGQRAVAAGLRARYPWGWLVAAFVVASRKGADLLAVERFIRQWLEDPAVRNHAANPGRRAPADPAALPFATAADAPARAARPADAVDELDALEAAVAAGLDLPAAFEPHPDAPGLYRRRATSPPAGGEVAASPPAHA